ncbi:MAG: acyl-CoA dehydrogenase family protein, partial [Minwuiales bacterium]|nr:acyl-CoA dehydrogenase family protein [Minwuiales bacterium]
MIPRTLFDEEHDIFRESVRRFVEDEVVPHHAAWEEAGVVSREVWLKAGEQGLLCPTVPEEYGGPGADFRYSTVVVEELARVGATGPAFHLHSDIVAPYIVQYGSEEQKQEWLPRMVRGEAIGAIAMSEPGAGSDLQNIQTRAVRDGNNFVINGQKIFITNGQLADLVILVTKTDPALGAKGVSLVLVERERDG